MLTIFNQTIIMLIIIITGVLCSKTGVITENGNKELSKLVLTVINPMVIFMSYQTDYKPELVKNLLITFVLSILSYAILVALAYILIRNKEGRETEIERFSTIYSNCGFMGIPLVNALFGSIGVFYLTAFITVFNFVVWTHGMVLLSGEKDFKKVLKVFYSPVILSIVVGIIMFFLQIRVPSIVAQAFNFIADLNTPMAMIASGVTIANTNIIKLIKKYNIYYVAFLKLLLIPTVLVFVLSIFNIPDEIRLTVIIAASAPSATMCTLQCLRLGKNSLYASEIFAFTTIFSILTLPLVVRIDEIIGCLF